MAVTAWVPTKTIANVLGGETAGESIAVDFLSDTIKCALVQSAWAPNRDTVESYADVTNEASGSGYTAGGVTLAGKVITEDAANNRQKFDSDDAVWATVTVTARYAVVYDDTASTKVILCVVDFGEDKSASGAEFRVAPAATGWCYADAA